MGDAPRRHDSQAVKGYARRWVIPSGERDEAARNTAGVALDSRPQAELQTPSIHRTSPKPRTDLTPGLRKVNGGDPVSASRERDDHRGEADGDWVSPASSKWYLRARRAG